MHEDMASQVSFAPVTPEALARLAPMTARLEDLPERIRAKIKVNPATGCWEWQGYIAENGYGRINWERNAQWTHRVVYTLLAGPIPEGLTLDHVKARGCASPACCFPDHLEPVTQGENTRRAFEPITTCPKGHEYTPENTRIQVRGEWRSRHCKTCHRDTERERRRSATAAKRGGPR